MDSTLYRIAKQFNQGLKSNINYDRDQLFYVICNIFAQELLANTTYPLDYEQQSKLNYLVNNNLNKRITDYD